MRRKNIFSVVLLLISALLFSVGIYRKVEHKTNEKTFFIAVIPAGTINMWYEVVHQGALKAASEEKVRISWNGPELETDREKQIQAIEDAIIKNADAIVIGPNDYQALVRPIEAICERKIPCILIDSIAATEKYDSFVATDNYQGGVTAARLLGKAIGGKGKVLVIQCTPNTASNDDRYYGFADTIKKEFPGIVILSAPYTSGTIEDARQKTVDLLVRYPDTDAIFAVSQPASVGAYKGIENQHLGGKVTFVAFDSDPVLLDGIQSGTVLAVISQNPFEIGYQGVKQAVRCLRGEKILRTVALPSMIVRKENLDEMKRLHPQALGL